MAKPTKPTSLPDGLKSRLIADVTTQTDTTYTLVSSDDLVLFDNAAAITVTIPPRSAMSVPWIKGQTVNICQYGAGQVTMAAGSGVTINSAGALLSTASQYSVLSAINVDGGDAWLLLGDLA